MHTVNIDISWEEPTYPNGIIQSYQVAVAATLSGFAVYSNDAVTDLAVTESVMVLPFTNYTVTVAASTSAGQGDESTVIILSPEAGIHEFINMCSYYVSAMKIFPLSAPSQVEDLDAMFVISGSTFNPTDRIYTLDINIEWIEPINPNGVITAY